MRDKQPAITKHPHGTASFCFRVMLRGGANWEATSTKPRPISELIESIETMYLPMMRRFAAGEASDAVVSTSVETVEKPGGEREDPHAGISNTVPNAHPLHSTAIMSGRRSV
jgi:radical SAM superfamily enzyme with C-terminal helix-hairpin-helix motif